MCQLFPDMSVSSTRHNVCIALALAVLVAAAWWVAAPALSGPFILDDDIHLPKLAGDNGAIDTQREALKLIFSGGSATGRPLAFASLLIEDHAWPTDPRAFKRTNLLIHLLNGLLVFLLARAILRLLPGTETAAHWMALTVCAAWLLHPMQLSPIMMVIQRMTLLMATFSLLGLLLYLHGRRNARDQPLAGYTYMSIGIGVFGVLSAFSKDTGVMLVCYVIALEATLLARFGPPRPAYYRGWATIFLLLPLIGVSGYFFLEMGRMDALYAKRDFVLVERLLTEARVLVDYLRMIVAPTLSGTGPYHDDYLVSRGLLSPPTTLACVMAIGSLITSAIWMRKRSPVFAFAVLWFFLGHLLESTILPLELYFEHRNYLPMIGPLLAVVYLLTQVPEKQSIRSVVIVGLGVYCIALAGITHASARVWGNPALIANVWAAEHPGSLRAQLDAIQFWLARENFERARSHYTTVRTLNPEDAGLYAFGVAVNRCNKLQKPIFPVSVDLLLEEVPDASFDHASISALQFLQKRIDSDRCRITHDELVSIIHAYLSNPRFRRVSAATSAIYQTLSKVHRSQGDLDASIRALDAAFEAMPHYELRLNQAYLLATAGLFDEAAVHIQMAKDAPMRSPWTFLWKDEHIEEVAEIVAALERKWNRAKENLASDNQENTEQGL